jgi:hypothetical protein
MATQIVSFSTALPHGTIPGAYQEQQMDGAQTLGSGANFHFSTRDLMSEFVSLLKENPNVWAVAANGDQGGIDVWTYLDSANKRDREAIYELEWQLMTRHPEVAFDFSTILAAAQSVAFERRHYSHLYTR